MKQLSARQQKVLAYIGEQPGAATRQVLEMLNREWEKVSRVTVIRDMRELVKLALLKQTGRGRSVRYTLPSYHPLLKPVAVEEYFRRETDKREVKSRLDFSQLLKTKIALLTSQEKREGDGLTLEYRQNMKRLPASAIKKEFERITIEFSWKSSLIEGNTYSLLDTEQLLKGGVEAAGHTAEEARMILNHKEALTYIRENLSRFRKMSVADMENIHGLTVEKMGVEKGLRRRPVGIVGTKYLPNDNHYQIRESLQQLFGLVNRLNYPLEKALLAVAGISYIQPFADGNKRTARLVGNAFLLANEMCPLSYRSVDEVEYKKAMVVFYEQHSLRYFKEIFLGQYRAAVKTYFRS